MAPAWVGGLLVVVVVLLLFWGFMALLYGIIWLRYNGPWPVRAILAIPVFIITAIAVLITLGAIKDYLDQFKR